MPTSCAVRGCKSRGSGKNNSIKYYRFPKDENRRLTWLKAINREHFIPTNNSMICNAHFTKDDYQNRPDLIKLTNKAVPSVFNSVECTNRNSKRYKSVKSVKKCHDNLADHNYVLRIPEESPEKAELSTSVEIKSKILLDESICLIKVEDIDDYQTSEDIKPFNIDINPINIDIKPKKIDIKPENIDIKPAKINMKPVKIDIINPYYKVPKISDHDLNELKKSEKKWKEIALSQSITIKELRKKVKVLQQKIRRSATKIETLKMENVHQQFTSLSSIGA